ncbi:MAG: hypothetical protein R2827_01660 [Bdellovibrionales bacterium]
MQNSDYARFTKAALSLAAGSSIYYLGVSTSEAGFAPDFIADYHQTVLEALRMVVDSAQIKVDSAMAIAREKIDTFPILMEGAYAAAGSVSAQLIYFGFYGFLPYIFRNAENRNASNSKVSYQAMKRFFASMNYGLSARYHEQLMSKNLVSCARCWSTNLLTFQD